MNAKVIAFATEKGGQAKTCTCLNFGAYEARKGKKILIIDLDYQRNISLMFPKADKGAVKKANIYRAFQHDANNVESSFPSDFKPAHVAKNIDLFSGSIKLDTVDELMSQKPNLATTVLLNVFVMFKLQSKYDYILIDCHNSFGTATVNGLICSDYIICPTTPNFFSINAIGDMMNKLTELKHNYFNVSTRKSYIQAKLYFVGSMIYKATNASKDFLASTRDNPQFIADFPKRELVNKAVDSQTNIFDYADKGNSTDKRTVKALFVPEFKKIENVVSGKGNQ